MSIVIYELAHSPYCIPITAALRSCGVTFETREVPNWDRSEIIRLTHGAHYQVPLLVHDGQMLFETAEEPQRVSHYVDRTFAGGRLFPKRIDGLQEIVIDHLENEVEGVTFRLCDIHYVPSIEDLVRRTMVLRHKERRFGRGCIDAWKRDEDAIRAEADRLLERFEITLRHSPFLFGDAPVYSDFLLYGIIGNMTWKQWNSLKDEQTALRSWVDKIRDYRFTGAGGTPAGE
ncbi:MAG TPA: glutathione S-transferase family protein [Chthoniobacteraceae bacterium]